MLVSKSKCRRLYVSIVIAVVLISLFTVVYHVLPVVKGDEAWWNSSWQYRKSITINHLKVVSDLTNFPVLVDLTDSDLTSKAQTDGDDIVFVAGGSKLDHEIEVYSSGNGRLVAWIRVPSLSNTTDTVLYIYYGNPTVSSQQNSAGVWDSNFKIVQHFEEASGTCTDSTSNQNNGTPKNGVVQNASGKIDGACDFDGTNDYVDVGSDASIDDLTLITISTWIKMDAITGAAIYDKNFTKGKSLYVSSGNLAFVQGFTGGSPNPYGWWRTSTASLTAGSWFHLAVTYNSSSLANDPTLYINGALPSVFEGNVPSGTALSDANYNATMGGSISALNLFTNGITDEVRVSNILRSNGWITTEYNNQQSPSTFYAVGSEETQGYAPTVSNPNPSNGATGVSTSLSQLSFDLGDPQSDLMNYSVTTSPNVGSGSGTNVGNGTYSVSVSGLTIETDYTWQVNVTDGTNWTNVTYHFDTRTPPPPPTMAPNWLNITSPPFPLTPDGIINPVMTAAKVTDRSAQYVYNPRIFYENGTWYMFFAVALTAGGPDIGLATSSDGFNYTYKQIVLDTAYFLASPFVFKSNGTYYMMPSTHDQNDVRLFKAANFPYNWTYECSIVSGKVFVDPCAILYNNTWWLFVCEGTNCRLYYSDKLTVPASWMEHPSSPIVNNDASKARPAGRNIVYYDNKIIRWAMKNDVSFGEKVRAFQVDTLTKTSYAEHEIPESPVLGPSGSGWNKDGMHNVDPWWIGDKWLVAVDGVNAATWSIGVYLSVPPPRMIPDWSNVTYSPYPVSGNGILNPVLTGSKVTDVSASFVADPFLFYENGTWYMFFEVQKAVGCGDIGVATSTDGFNFTYRQIVLAEGHHHAFPTVFKWNGTYYLMPSSHETNDVRLYKATGFPYNWTYVCSIVSGKVFVDPCIILYNSTWWLFTCTGNDQMWLYYSDKLEDPSSWTMHPNSPVVTGADKARPGGRVIIYNGTTIVRHPQKCDVSYGEKVRAFQIDTLTKTSYAEHEIPESPVLVPSGSGWNKDGMHNFDPWWTGDRWIASVDGVSGGTWSIGIYMTPSFSHVPIVSDPYPPENAVSVPTSLSALAFNLSDSQGHPMNYSVTTSPSIGSGSGTNVTNGRYSVPTSGLANDTDYVWQVNVTDGVYWANATYHFTTRIPPPPPPMVPDWSNMTFSPYPLIPNGIVNPVMTSAKVTDRSATMVYQPFLFYESGTWYMFFTVNLASGSNDIGLATSSDGYNWTYKQIVLDETFFLSNPVVFKWNGTYYMVPCTYSQSDVRLYRATNFPYTWTYVCSIVSGRTFLESSIFLYNNTWWLFTGESPGDKCRLYYSDILTDPSSWHEHPNSPIVNGDTSKARVAGRYVLCNNKLIRWAMKNDVTFGEKVRAFQIDTLTKTSYAEHEIPESPVLGPSGSGWNSAGMHHVDPWWTGDRWIASVDGVSGGTWSIGIYETTPIVYTLTVLTSGQGSVNLNNSGPYHYGDVVQLTAVPAAGWSFGNWSGDLSGSASPATIVIDGNKTVTAAFTQNVYTLTVSTVGNGVVNLNNSGPYHYGDVVQLTAVPANDWSFQYWSDGLTGSANPATLVISGDLSVIAHFTTRPRLIMNPSDGTCRRFSENLAVQINVTNAGSVDDFRFEVHFNATLLDVADVSWNAWTGTYTVDEVNGILTGYGSGSPISGNVTLLTITFNATYHHMWKDESTVFGWKNIQTGTVYFQWANLSYPSGPDLRYERGGLNQIDVGPDFVYAFSPIRGDVDNDGLVDVFDLRAVAAYYAVEQGDPNWAQASTYDLNGDGIIDIFDLVIVATNYGYTYSP
jgi:hypothetical protein